MDDCLSKVKEIIIGRKKKILKKIGFGGTEKQTNAGQREIYKDMYIDHDVGFEGFGEREMVSLRKHGSHTDQQSTCYFFLHFVAVIASSLGYKITLSRSKSASFALFVRFNFLNFFFCKFFILFPSRSVI